MLEKILDWHEKIWRERGIRGMVKQLLLVIVSFQIVYFVASVGDYLMTRHVLDDREDATLRWVQVYRGNGQREELYLTQEQGEALLEALRGTTYRGFYGPWRRTGLSEEEERYAVSVCNQYGGGGGTFYLREDGSSYLLNALSSPRLGNTEPVIAYLDELLEGAE